MTGDDLAAPDLSNYLRALHFHLRIGDEPPARPVRPDGATLELRMRLLREEAAEALDALEALRGAQATETQDEALAAAAHELADLLYVAYGTFVALGVDADAAYAEVHAANMRKAGAPRRADGKQLRPPDWRPADLMAVVARQRTTADQGRHVEALTEAEGGPERR